MNRYAQYFIFLIAGVFLLGLGVGSFLEKYSIHSVIIVGFGVVIEVVGYFRYKDIDAEMDKLVGLK